MNPKATIALMQVNGVMDYVEVPCGIPPGQAVSIAKVALELAKATLAVRMARYELRARIAAVGR